MVACFSIGRWWHFAEYSSGNSVSSSSLEVVVVVGVVVVVVVGVVGVVVVGVVVVGGSGIEVNFCLGFLMYGGIKKAEEMG